MRTRVLFVAPVAAILALAACSSDDDSSSTTTAAATTVATTTAATTAAPTSAAPTTAAATTVAPTTTAAQPDTVADILRTPKFVQLGLLLGNAKLFPTLEGTGPFTVFAPSHEAMMKLGADQLNALGTDAAAATPILLYHVVPGKLTAADLTTGDLTTASGATLPVVVNGDEITVGGAKIIEEDLEAGNGVVHVIDTPLTPPAG